MKREFGDFILDIKDCSHKAIKFVNGISLEEFESDDKTVFAVMKAIEIGRGGFKENT